MNILICSNRYFLSGGPERYLFFIQEMLETNGHKVVPFAIDFAKNKGTPYSKYFVPHPVNKNFVYYSDAKLSPYEKIRLLFATLYNPDVVKRVKKAIRAENIDLVYALQVGNLLSPGIFQAAHALGVPVVSRQSDFQLMCPAYHFLRANKPCEACKNGLHHAIKYRCLKGSVAVSAARVTGMYVERGLRIAEKTAAFVTPTSFLKEKLIEFGFSADKIAHIPTAIDAESIEPTYEDGNHLLYCGNLNLQKGVGYLIEAMQHLPEVQLKIAGKSSEGTERDIESLIRRLGLSNVTLVGFKSGDELADLYRNAFAAVFPTIWYENMPNSVLEAMAYGKPLIASRIGSMTELISDGENGLLVEPANSSALGEAISKLHADRALARSMGKASRERVMRDHTPDMHYARLLALFESCHRDQTRLPR